MHHGTRLSTWGRRGTERMHAHHLRRYRICSSPSSRSQCRLEFQPFCSASEFGPPPDFSASTSSSCSVMLIELWGKYEQQTLKAIPEGKADAADQSALYISPQSPAPIGIHSMCHASRPTLVGSQSIRNTRAYQGCSWPCHSTSSLQ